MTFHRNDQEKEYARFRRQSLAHAEHAVRAQIQDAERRIAELQSRLVHNRFRALPTDLGLFAVWNDLRQTCEEQIKTLAAQPWLEEVKLLNGKDILQVIARRQDGPGHLVVVLGASKATPVDIQWPQVAADRKSALFTSALNALAAEGCLVAVIELCATQCGVTLAAGRAHASKIDRRVVAAYHHQRAAWLSDHLNAQVPHHSDPMVLVRQLDDDHRLLYLLEARLAAVNGQMRSPNLEESFCREWRDLHALPQVKALAIHGEAIELRTEVIRTCGVTLGQYLVLFDFATRQITIHNLTRPIFSDGFVYAHPHVRGAVACLGSAAAQTAEFLAARDVPHLVGLMIEFLESYNSGSPYRSIDFWR